MKISSLKAIGNKCIVKLLDESFQDIGSIHVQTDYINDIMKGEVLSAGCGEWIGFYLPDGQSVEKMIENPVKQGDHVYFNIQVLDSVMGNQAFRIDDNLVAIDAHSIYMIERDGQMLMPYDRVLVELEKGEKILESGLIIPEQELTEQEYVLAKVLACGVGKVDRITYRFDPMPVKVGDTIAVDPKAIHTFDYLDKEYNMVLARQILFKEVE